MQGRWDEARTIAEGLCASAARDGRNWHKVPHLALLARSQYSMDDRGAAQATIRELLAIASRAQSIWSLALEGEPLLRVMQSLPARGEFDDLIGAIQHASHHLHPPLSDSQPRLLSKREMEVLRLVASGSSNKEISSHLAISIPTVKRHISNIFYKLDAANRTDAVFRAHGLSLL